MHLPATSMTKERNHNGSHTRQANKWTTFSLRRRISFSQSISRHQHIIHSFDLHQSSEPTISIQPIVRPAHFSLPVSNPTAIMHFTTLTALLSIFALASADDR